MVDPRRGAPHTERGEGDDDTHPDLPSVGGPTPDPRLGNPKPVKVRNRWTIGIAIAVVVALAVGFLIWYWTTGAVDGAAVSPESPPVTTAAAQPAAQPERPMAQPGDCRTFTQEMEIAGAMRTVGGTACLEANGVWRIVAPD